MSTTSTSHSPGADCCWYFAYGSNMQRDTFARRRGLRSLRSVPARLDGYRLCFDLPVGTGERGVANVVRDASEHVWGVLHSIASLDLSRLDSSEGVGRGWYERIEVDVVALGTERACVRAWTFSSRLRSDGRKPSPRYLGLLLEGAREHGLPADWIARLEALEPAVDERLEASKPLPATTEEHS